MIRGILNRLGLLIEALAEVLLQIWEEVADGQLRIGAPAAAWSGDHSSPPRRVAAAECFQGFDPNAAEPALTSIVMNPRDSRRAAVAERLRTS